MSKYDNSLNRNGTLVFQFSKFVLGLGEHIKDVFQYFPVKNQFSLSFFSFGK